MAIPNLYNPISYPDITPKTPLSTFWSTIAPYENLKDLQLGQEVKRQKMALDQNEDARNQTLLELQQAQEGRAQKQEGRAEREFEEKESEWERKKGLREAVIGAAAKANGDPMQTLLNIRNVYLMSGDASLGIELQDAATKVIGTLPSYAAKAQAWGLMGTQVTPEELARQDAKIFASPDGAAIYTPGGKPEFFQSPQGAQEMALKQRDLDQRQQSLNQAAQQKSDEMPTGERLTLGDIGDEINAIQKMDAAKQQNLSLGLQIRDGLLLEEAEAKAAQVMRNDPTYKFNQQRVKELTDRKNMLLKKRYPGFEPAGHVEMPEPDAGAPGAETSDLDNFLMGVGVRTPGGQAALGGPVASGGAPAPGQAKPLAPVYNPGMGTAPYQLPVSSGGSATGLPGLRGVDTQQRLTDPENLRRAHAVMQEQALARLEANPALFMSYVQSSDPDLQEAAKAFQQRVMQSR